MKRDEEMKRHSLFLLLLIAGITFLSGCTTIGEDLEERNPKLVISWSQHPINKTNQVNITDISDVLILGSTVDEVIDAIPDGDTHREKIITQMQWDQIERRFELLNLKPSSKSPTSWSLYIDTIPFWIELVYIILTKVQEY